MISGSLNKRDLHCCEHFMAVFLLWWLPPPLLPVNLSILLGASFYSTLKPDWLGMVARLFGSVRLTPPFDRSLRSPLLIVSVCTHPTFLGELLKLKPETRDCEPSVCSVALLDLCPPSSTLRLRLQCC